MKAATTKQTTKRIQDEGQKEKKKEKNQRRTLEHDPCYQSQKREKREKPRPVRTFAEKAHEKKNEDQVNAPDSTPKSRT
jgi:hypothetical protein